MSDEPDKKISALQFSIIRRFEQAAQIARRKVPWPWSVDAYEAHLRKKRSVLMNELSTSLRKDLGTVEEKAQRNAVITAGGTMLGRIRVHSGQVRQVVHRRTRDFYKRIGRGLSADAGSMPGPKAETLPEKNCDLSTLFDEARIDGKIGR